MIYIISYIIRIVFSTVLTYINSFFPTFGGIPTIALTLGTGLSISGLIVNGIFLVKYFKVLTLETVIALAVFPFSGLAFIGSVEE